jgi:Gram-negative bacterial TonB protein C-terminal
MRSLAVSILLVELASSLLPAQRYACKPTQSPRTLPVAHAILDSTGAIQDLSTARLLRDSMTFSLLYRAPDSLPSVRPLDSLDAPAARVLTRALWPQTPSDVWAVRVHIVGGAAPAVTIERSSYCPPLPPPDGGPTAHTRAVMMATTPPAGTRRVVVKFEALISELGQVLSVRITQSSRMRDIDDAIVRDVMLATFKPALLDGLPVQALYRSDGESPRP